MAGTFSHQYESTGRCDSYSPDDNALSKPRGLRKKARVRTQQPPSQAISTSTFSPCFPVTSPHAASLPGMRVKSRLHPLTKRAV